MFELRLRCTDHATGAHSTHSIPLAVPMECEFLPNRLTIQSHMRYHDGGPIRKSPILYADERVHFEALVTGLALDERGRTAVEANAILYRNGQPDPLGDVSICETDRSNFGGNSFFLDGELTISPRMGPGQYTIKVSIKDLLTGKLVMAEIPYLVAPSHVFGVTNVRFVATGGVVVSSPAGGVEVIKLNVVNAVNDSGECDVIGTIDFVDLESNETLCSESIEMKQIGLKPTAKLRFDLPIVVNRSGRFELRLLFVNRLTGETWTTSMERTVYSWLQD